MKEVIIDVRERDEYKAEHVAESINVPLSQFGTVAPGVLAHFMDRKILLMCRSGKRSEMAAHEARRLGFSPEGGLEIYGGGILKWKELGGQTIAPKAGHLPILRQTHLVAGLLALSGVILGYTVSPGFLILSGLVGAGLSLAGATGLCLMSELLAKMPWNKDIPEIRKEVCQATKGDDSCATVV